MSDSEYEILPGTLQNILDQQSLKWIFLSGKGGTGKSSSSSSLAIQMAKVRRNVLVISTDPAHNLSDAFCQKLGKEPVQISGIKNLFAMEVDPNTELEDPQAQGSMGGMMQDFMNSIPGIDEAMSFAEVLKLVDKDDYDCVIFDTAPTGHTLRLLGFPDLLDRALTQLMDLGGKYGSMIGQFSSMLGTPNMNFDDILVKMKETKVLLDQVIRQFKDPEYTTFICVCIAEFLSLYETERLVQELTKLEIDCHNIVVNQLVLPEANSTCKLCKSRISIQKKYLEQIEELYEDFHIIKVPLLTHEVRGVEQLTKFGELFLHE